MGVRTRYHLTLIDGGKKKDKRPVLTAAKVFGIVALVIFLLAVFTGCGELKVKTCCLQRHEECIDPTFSAKDCMDTTYSVCDVRGTLNDAGVCL
jgi:hypothetical protein